MTPGEYSDAKRVLRAAIRIRMAALEQVERASSSRQILEKIDQSPTWRAARALLLFAALADEPDVTPLIGAALQAGRLVALPRYVAANGEYEVAWIRAGTDLVPGRFGVLEPGTQCPVVDFMQLDFVLVPGVGFDLAGRRLGRGRGFYDRLLARFPGHKCGVAFDCQVVAEVPEELHDVRLNSLVTPTRWHCFERAA